MHTAHSVWFGRMGGGVELGKVGAVSIVMHLIYIRLGVHNNNNNNNLNNYQTWMF